MSSWPTWLIGGAIIIAAIVGIIGWYLMDIEAFKPSRKDLGEKKNGEK